MSSKYFLLLKDKEEVINYLNNFVNKAREEALDYLNNLVKAEEDAKKKEKEAKEAREKAEKAKKLYDRSKKDFQELEDLLFKAEEALHVQSFKKNDGTFEFRHY